MKNFGAVARNFSGRYWFIWKIVLLLHSLFDKNNDILP
jgi:hypothetical protein